MFVNFAPTPTRKSCRLRDNVEKYGRAGQVTNENITRRMRLRCRIPEATDTHSEYIKLIAFPRQKKMVMFIGT